MEEEKQNRRREVEVSLPGGVKVKARGYDIIIILVVACVSVITYIVFDSKSVVASEISSLHKEHKGLLDGIETTNWILLQTPEKRAELAKQIDMPIGLKKQLRDATAKND